MPMAAPTLCEGRSFQSSLAFRHRKAKGLGELLKYDVSSLWRSKANFCLVWALPQKELRAPCPRAGVRVSQRSGNNSDARVSESPPAL